MTGNTKRATALRMKIVASDSEVWFSSASITGGDRRDGAAAADRRARRDQVAVFAVDAQQASQHYADDHYRDYRNHREGHAFAPGGQRFVEVHAESQSDDAVLQQFFRSLLAPDRKRIAEGQGEENAREERDDGRTEERTYEQSGKKDLAPVELCGLHGFRELQRFHTVLITFCKRCCKYTGFIPLKQRGKSYVV